MKKIRYYKFIKLEKIAMNCKLEKFWNALGLLWLTLLLQWTINLKSFEIAEVYKSLGIDPVWTINLKSFEITIYFAYQIIYLAWTVNLKSFEITIYKKSRRRGTIWTVNLKSFEM